ncbi:unnamed protein product [Vitrella brassicaformis CCMP3155]|uniref:Pre-mRNA-splicing factor SPF27 n=2 Tax=Vitrella brassicaformis TaxID=1169539 RepID=A0A0G4FNJ2_VITBC|nr:unnamed protein product [Vitrella brassicaformis CCMP3155]|eukprot:CEM15606.1 unnamed protein product [Vitrella brassicaformis CCMP3155]
MDGGQPQYLFQDNEGWDLVDALPYIDPLPADLQQEVRRLVEEEMSRMPPRDYLASLPKPATPVLDSDPVIKGEMERIKMQRPMAKLDQARLNVEVPSGAKAADVGEWKKSLENAEAQLEHSNVRMVNLELMHKNAQKVWLNHLQQLEHHHTGLQSDVKILKRDMDEVNKRRKLDQVSCGNTLRTLGREWEELVDRNGEILQAVGELEEDVAWRKRKCRDRGILPDKYLHDDEPMEVDPTTGAPLANGPRPATANTNGPIAAQQANMEFAEGEDESMMDVDQAGSSYANANGMIDANGKE